VKLLAALGLACALLACAPAAGASTEPNARVLLGVLGEPSRFQQLTGQRSDIRQSFIAGTSRARSRSCSASSHPSP
jgi:hypothetical protein